MTPDPSSQILSATDATQRAAPAWPTWRIAAMLLTAFVFCAIPAWQMIVPGPFEWPLTQPIVYQGGIEAVLLIVLVAAASLLPQRPRWIIWFALAALYLRRHAVDLPLLVDVLYLEIVIGVGAAIARIAGAGRAQDSADYLRHFILGLCGWSVCAWTLSALGWGSPQHLRWLTLLLCIPVFAMRQEPLSLYALRRVEQWPALERMLASALAAGVLVQFARTNVVAGYDLLWYGLRGEYVLAGDGSAFAPMGLVSPVFYFPKMYEMLLLPLAGLGDYSVISGLSLGMLVLLALTVNELLKQHGLADRLVRLGAVALCMTLPAIANASIECKPDIIAALLVTLAWHQAQRWMDGESDALAWMVACGLLAAQAKLTAVPFLGMLFVGTAVTTWRRRHAVANMAHASAIRLRLGITALFLSATVALFVCARTFLLTGMPTIGPDPLFKLWQKLGFSLRPPAGTLQWTYPQDWSDVPALMVDWTFRPERLDHIITFWVGNVWLWLPLVAVLVLGWRTAAPKSPAPRLGLWLVAAGLILALGWRYHVRGSDGNYFICALVAAIVLGMQAFGRRLGNDPRMRHAALACLLVFVTMHSATSFISAGWSAGTRALDLSFTRSVRDTRERNRYMIESAGVTAISEHLRVEPGTARVIGCMEFEIGTRLPARFEDIQSISFSYPDYVKDADALVAYMQRHAIPFIILPKTDRPTSTPPSHEPNGLCAPSSWKPRQFGRVIEDRDYLMYDIRPASVSAALP